MKRGLLLTVVATAVAGALLLLTSGRTWGAVTIGAAGVARQHARVTGHDIAPALSALGLALLAMSVALLAARGPLRRVGGLLVVLLGASGLSTAVRAHGKVGHALASHVFATSATSVGGSRSGWWLVAVAAGAIAVVAGAAATIGAGGRGGLGAKYDAPTAASPSAAGSAAPTSMGQPETTTGEPVDVWDAIEQGRDPTVGH